MLYPVELGVRGSQHLGPQAVSIAQESDDSTARWFADWLGESIIMAEKLGRSKASVANPT